MTVKLPFRLLASILVAGSTLLFSGCGKDDDSGNDPTPTPPANNWTGTLVHDWSSSVRQYSFATKADPELFDGRMPYRMANGSTLHTQGIFESMAITNANGTQTTVVYNANETTAVYAPQVSPDGTKIAFSHRKVFEPSQYAVRMGTVITDLQGNYITGIPDIYNAVWLPDGRLVGTGDFSTNGYQPSTPAANAGLYIVTLNGTSHTLSNINTSISNPSPLLPSVSPDGSKVAFILNKHLWSMNLDGSNLKQITASDNDNEESFSTWSPDGRHIAVWSYKTFENTYYTAIAVVPADPAQPTVSRNDAPIWPRDQQGFRLSGGNGTISWR